MNEELKHHATQCPIGFIEWADKEPQLMCSKGSTNQDFVNWLKRLKELCGVEDV